MVKVPPMMAETEVRKEVKATSRSSFWIKNGLNSYTKKTPGRPVSSPCFTITFFAVWVTAY